MKTIITICFFLICSGLLYAQEYTCPNPEDTECDLLPDIGLSRSLLLDPEQNPEAVGSLGVSVGTPNIGHGPLRIMPTNNFICSGDTINAPLGIEECPDGSAPRQLIKQVIYRKVGDAIDTYLRDAGTMTYHPTHEHIHVDEWGTYSIREEVEGVEDPRLWPIVVAGSKLGFCLMDLEECGDPLFAQDCELPGGLPFDAETFPNYGLGGGQYNCAAEAQGISVGFLDIYHYYLDGMTIDIPYDVCNGTYKLVVEADPKNFFLEEDETNNYVAVDIELTQQGNQPEEILEVNGSTVLCPGETVELTCNFGIEPLWSTGEVAQSITVSEAGFYSVSSATDCVAAESQVIEVVYREVENPVTTAPESICQQESATIMVNNATGDVFWYDNEALDGVPIATGTEFETPILGSSTDFYVVHETVFPGLVEAAGPYDNTIGSGAINSPQFNGGLVMKIQEPVTLVSATFFAETAGNRTIVLSTGDGSVIEERVVYIAAGSTEVVLDLDLPVGGDITLSAFGADGVSSPELYRNQGGVEYPYVLPGALEIVNSSFGSSYYYYFYNMQIRLPDQTCSSPAQKVTVEVEPCGVNTQEVYEDQSIVLLPNPAKDYFQLQFDVLSSQHISISMIDMAGKEVYAQKLSNFSGKFDQQIAINDLSAGVYIVEIARDTGKSQRKLIVQ